jgi:DNA-cytosine methyltransferase
MKILSLFDGMSAGRIALERAGFEVEEYYASEIDKYAVQVSKDNYPDIIHIGDVTQVSYKDGVLHTQFGSYQTDIDMVIGGSPCQSFSVAGNGKGFDGSSGLFYEWVRILREVNPKYFLLENVCMKKEWENVITQEVGVNPIMINSALVSAQNRKRLYWTNIEGITQPKDKGILLRDILENFIFDKEPYYIVFNSNRPKNYKSDKSMCLVTSGGSKTKGVGISDDSGMWIKITPIECERLQTIPDDYTKSVSNSQRYKMISNGWTVDVIAHIFSFISANKC